MPALDPCLRRWQMGKSSSLASVMPSFSFVSPMQESRVIFSISPTSPGRPCSVRFHLWWWTLKSRFGTPGHQQPSGYGYQGRVVGFMESIQILKNLATSNLDRGKGLAKVRYDFDGFLHPHETLLSLGLDKLVIFSQIIPRRSPTVIELM